MAEIVQSLFGVTPQSYQQQQRDAADNRALQYAKLDPFQQANYAIGRGAYGLAGAIGGALGAQDPELQRVTMRQQILGTIDPNRLETFDQAAQMALQAGDQQLAYGLRMEADKNRRVSQESTALIGQREAAAAASLASASRESKQASPKEAQLADLVARRAGPQGSAEYQAAFNASIDQQMAPKEAKGPGFGAEAERYAKSMFQGKTYAQLTPEQAEVVNKRVEEEGGRKAAARASRIDVDVKLPAQEKKFEEGIGKGQAERVLANQIAAQDAAEILRTNQVGRDILKSGAITGTGANFFVGLNNALAQAGIDFGYADAASNSQAYVAAMGANVGRIIKQFGAGTGLSNDDREYAAKIAAGQITLTETALRRILDINDKAANRVIDLHNKNVKDIKTNIPLTVEKPNFAKPNTTPSSGLSASEQAELDQLRSRFGRSTR